MRKIYFVLFFITLSLGSSRIFSESITTNLTEPAQIEEFLKATSKIRCICLPSLPIKSCSFNNCEISALLKEFIENRIKKGETSEQIVEKMEKGFGEEVMTDPIIQKFLISGNTSIVDGVVNGFGEKILAEPDSTWINFTLIAVMILGMGGIFLYGKKLKSRNSMQVDKVSSSTEKYLQELD